MTALAEESTAGAQTLTVPSRLRKLRTMSPAEVLARFGSLAFEMVERQQLRRGVPSHDERLARGIHAPLRRSTDWREQLLEGRAKQAHFFPAFSERSNIRERFHRTWPSLLQESRRNADAAVDHRFEFFGQTFTYGRTVDWHADPVSGRRWPFRFHADVPTSGCTEWGDVKYVWELNRHQFLIDLGKAAFLFEDPRYAGALEELVLSWIAENPYGQGVNWASPLEPAFRVLSWLPAYYCCLDAPVLTRETHLTWLAAFLDHGRFLHRHLEYYSSPFNHLVGEACALYMLGVLFPEFTEASAWRRRGRAVLESRLSRQFYGDGGGSEQATFYHHATLGFYLLAALLGRSNGEEFSAPVWQTIERAIEFSAYLMQPDGRVPAIGDADDGKPIRFEHRPFWDFRAFQTIGAVLFDRSDFKALSGGFHEDALWLLGTAGLDRFDRLRAVPPDTASRAFRDSGYFVLRSDWSRTADFVCFDCGEQGVGARHDAVPDALHGHADCLAVVTFLGGEPLFIDAGFLSYNGPDRWQNHFRKTAAHNTVLIDGRDQSRHLGKMAWSHTPRFRQEHWVADDAGSRAIGSHDGYARGDRGVRHRRTVWLRPAGYVVIYDELTGIGDHRVELTFQMPAGASAVLDRQSLLVSGRFRVSWQASTTLDAVVAAGGSDADEGWVAPSLGVRAAAPRLRLSGDFSSPETGILTICVDTARVREVAPLRLDAGMDAAIRCLAVSVRTDDREDLVVAVGGPQVHISGLETDARVVICSESGNGHADAAGAGETYLRVQPATLRAALGPW